MRWAKYIKWGKNCTIAMISSSFQSGSAPRMQQPSVWHRILTLYQKKIIYTTARKTKPEKKTAAVDEKDGEK